MAHLEGYRGPIAWQKSMDLAEAIDKATSQLPSDERFGLTSQMRRAAVSVASNIAEGQARGSTGEFIHFLGIARGSLAELETQTELAARLKSLTCEATESLLSQQKEVGRLVNGLLNSLRSKS